VTRWSRSPLPPRDRDRTPDTGGDAVPADEPQADQTGGDEAVVAEPGPAAEGAAGDGGEITTAGTDSADVTASAGEEGAGLRVYGDSAYGNGAARAAYRDAGDRAEASASGRPRRIHPPQLHHRRTSGAVICSAGTPGDEPATDGDLRRAVRGLPATAALPRRRRLVDERPPAQAAAAPRPAPLTGLWQVNSRITLGATDGV
jgi:hypothetical protein